MIVGLTLPICLLLASCSGGKGEQKKEAEQKKEIVAPEKQVSAKDADSGVVIGSQRPADIPGGAASATLTQAAQFAWNQFIALNWPAAAQDGTNREKPDSAPFGTTAQPLVWQTYRSRDELYPWQKYLPPGATLDPNTGNVTFNYDAKPQYNYKNKILSCNQSASATPPWINLDEISQIGLNFMFDGHTFGQQYPASGNSAPTLIRFLAKGNRTYSDYITGKGYYNHGGNYIQDVTNFTNAVAADKLPVVGSFVEFPTDTVMVKSAWRLLTVKELASGRFYSAPVRFYEKKAGKLCYNDEAGWGMVALHIVQKSPSTPYFTFATFEQADNIKNLFGQPIEDLNGGLIAAPPGNPTTPDIAHTDYPNVTTTKTGDFCQPSNPRLFYQNSAPGLPEAADGHGGICVNKRRNSIPQEIIDINDEAHQKIRAYDKANNVNDSPWPYYKLVNVQFQPFNGADVVDNDANSNRLVSTYRQANIVVETNYTLQNFSGRLTDDGQTSDFTGTDTPFKNVVVANGDKSAFNRYNMGGCMGCHGNAQISGTDFSFMLNEGPEIEPEAPDFSNAARAALRKKYKF
jgi:hypothetical protein